VAGDHPKLPPRTPRNACNPSGKTAERLHEWRKHAKIHWYHAQFFADVSMARLDPQTELLRKLSRALGDHHDLVIIDELCSATPELFEVRDT